VTTSNNTASELETLGAKIRLCRNCDLCLTRTHGVPGEGNPRAPILFVGEAPGEKEDLSGRPFVGPAGKFLEEMLGNIGLERSDVFIANIIKCRPPGNRDPLPDEMEACRPFLREQIRLLAPPVVCTLGRFAMMTLVDAYASISKVHGQPREKDGVLYVPLYHPAAALHNPSLREVQIADMRNVRATLEARGLWRVG
jgi:uracil-DNA glycosylase